MKITIFWLAWSGTSTIWKLLAEKLDYKFMSSWNIMRWWAEELWLSIYDFEDKIVKNNDSLDIKLDKTVANFWKDNDSFIFESRLAWNFIPDSYKIYLKCDELERYNRIQSRELLMLDKIIYKTKKRENEVTERYWKIYPEIQFPPNDNMFDLVIDVTDILPDEIINIIVSRLGVYYMY